MLKKAYKKTNKKVIKPVTKYARKYVPKGTMANLGTKAGAAAGSYMGNPALGAMVGREVGKAVAKISGVGAYYVNPVSLMPSNSYMPQIDNSDDSVTISRSEYLCDLVSGPTSAWENNTFNINPGLDTSDNQGSFNWLPQIAQAYQKYEIKQLVFQFKSTSGDSTGSDTSLCQVSGGIQYVPSQGAFTSKAQLLDSQFAVSGKASQDLFFPYECDKRLLPSTAKSIRFGALNADQNIDNFDAGLFMISTQGSPTANQTLGEVWVHYKIKLFMHRSNTKGELTRTANYRWTGTAGSNIVSAYPIGQGTNSSQILVPSVGSSMSLTFDYANRIIYLPPLISSGVYMIVLGWRNSSAVAWATPAISYTNAESCDAFFSPDSTTVAQTGYLYTNVSTPTNNYFYEAFMFNVTAPNASVTLGNAGTLGSTVTDFNLFITELNTNAVVEGQ